MSERSSFALIELLIVLAIIAILAAIAAPNFLEAQIRAQVSHYRTDIRSIDTAIESYRIYLLRELQEAYCQQNKEVNDVFAQ